MKYSLKINDEVLEGVVDDNYTSIDLSLIEVTDLEGLVQVKHYGITMNIGWMNTIIESQITNVIIVNMNSKDFLKAINNLIVSGFDKLESVGCLLDSDVGSVYPMNEDGSPDWSNEINLYQDEVSDE